jgi:O-succinylbenzoic acid--CoA ligase
MKGSIEIGTDKYTFQEFVELDVNFKTNIDFKSIQKFIINWIKGNTSFVLQTSGSTGDSKSISISRQQMIASALMTGRFLNLSEADNALLCLNPEYIGGKMMLVRAMEIGLNLHVTPPTSNPINELPPLTQIQFAAFVPLQVDKLLKSKNGLSFLNSIDNIIIGGASVNSELQMKLQGVQSNVYSTYGMTETVSHIALKRLNGIGISDNFSLLPGIEIDIDQRGCLKIKSKVTSDQWIVTNDIVELTAKDSFKWIGRIDNVINSGGVKIQIEKLEAQIQSLIPSMNFIITSVQNQELGEEIVLLSEKRNLTSTEKDLLKVELQRYHFPKVFRLIDKLPITESGKPDRKSAREIVSSLA